MLRVIAGKYRSRKLDQPPLEITRPTPDRVREAIFSFLYKKIEGAIVLDLFSGSGAFAIESVSRGALKAIANDNKRQALKIIKENINNLKINNIDVFQMDAISLIKSKAGAQFDIIFLDPPFGDPKLYNLTLLAMEESGILSKNGYIIIECSISKSINIPNKFMIFTQKKYGKTQILVLTNK